MKIRKTPKLYYRSFPYKAKLKDASWIAAAFRYSMNDIKGILRSSSEWGYGKLGHSVIHETNKVLTLFNYLAKFKDDELRSRHEYTVSIFFKDRKIVDELNQLFPNEGPLVDILWEPNDTEVLDCLLTNQRIEVKKDLTHGCRYKVFLGNLNKSTQDTKEKFYNLTKNNPSQFHLTDSLTRSLTQHKHYQYYWGSGYFYVKDSKFLLLTQMLLNPCIREVVKIVTYEEINQNNVPVI